MNLVALRHAWTHDLLSRYDWQWFVTLTYDQSDCFRSRERVWREFHLAINKLNCATFGKHWKRRRQGVYYCAVLEPHKSGFPHMHALIGASEPLAEVQRRYIVNWWQQKFGRAQIEPPRHALSVQAYCTKTAGFDNDIELDGNFPPSNKVLLDRPYRAAAV